MAILGEDHHLIASRGHGLKQVGQSSHFDAVQAAQGESRRPIEGTQRRLDVRARDGLSQFFEHLLLFLPRRLVCLHLPPIQFQPVLLPLSIWQVTGDVRLGPAQQMRGQAALQLLR